MEKFEICHKINNFLIEGDEINARETLIRLLDDIDKKEEIYDPLINHLIRLTGLYPYIDKNTANWSDQFVYEAFKADTGIESLTLHREQSRILKMLLDGKNIAISAPTSFGKSFIIDAFIAISKPINVVIIVPTIALTDETRRRIHKKFSSDYKIITTTDVEMGEKNILIFPQERALSYINQIDSIDMLVVDEFYKASSKHDGERSASLLKAMIKLGIKAKQKYYLAPNISQISENVFTKDMEFVDTLSFNTVVLNIHPLYKHFNKDTKDEEKKVKLVELVKAKEKSLIYASSYSNIETVSNALKDEIEDNENMLSQMFATWLSKNYSNSWDLTALVRKGIGIHNGQLHRSISQIEIKLFEEDTQFGLNTIVSTSSIIEGVNTSAKNVIIWRNTMSGSNKRLNSFTYKNIIGRGGRMFKYFVGDIYLLESPPTEEYTTLEIPFPDNILGDLDENIHKDSLNNEQIKKIVDYKTEMSNILGREKFNELYRTSAFQSSDCEFLLAIAKEMKNSPNSWNGMSFLNSNNPNEWDRLLYKIIDLKKGKWDVRHSQFVKFIKLISFNWKESIPTMLKRLEEENITINEFFKLERNVAYKFASLVSDINILYKAIVNENVDICSFVHNASHAFLPRVVYLLEEYGLPRMISRKIQNTGLLNFECKDLTIHSVIQELNTIGKDHLKTLDCFDEFDKYILDYFYDGITINKK